MSRAAQCFAIWIVMTLLAVYARADEKNDSPVRRSAAELVQAIIAAENQIEKVESIYLRFEGKTTTTAEATQHRLDALREDDPEAKIDIAEHSELWAEIEEELELAFDAKRVRKLERYKNASTTLCVFDGSRFLMHSDYVLSRREYYLLDPRWNAYFNSFFAGLPSLKVGPHQLWFMDAGVAAEQLQMTGLPEDYTHLGQVEFRGRQCHLLENRQAGRHLYVGIEDGRLYGMTTLARPGGADRLPGMNRAAGKIFASCEEVWNWFDDLSAENKKTFLRKLREEEFPIERPCYESYLDDYRELAHGLWVPATQGCQEWDFLTSETPYIESHREIRLVAAKVNEPLAADLFTIELKDGVTVYDRHVPALVYEQKANRTAEEWAQIIAQQAPAK